MIDLWGRVGRTQSKSKNFLKNHEIFARNMKKIFIFTICTICFLGSGFTLHARGGGGCLMQGTPVLTPSGNVPVEQLKPGDIVFGVNRGNLTRAIVRSLSMVQPDHYIQLIVNGKIGLAVTQEHPVEVSLGVFRMASLLKSGNKVNIISQNRFMTGTITSISTVPARLPAYNLLVSPAGTFVANGIVVHNKGCFLPETLIRMADGTGMPISQIKQDDRVLAFKTDGTIVASRVHTILSHDVKEYRVVTAGNMLLHVTSEHPFYVGAGTFKTLDSLHINDTVVIFDGAGLSSQKITSIRTVHKKTRVYNLQTDSPCTFFANGVAVHNKGGGCFPAGTMILTPHGAVRIESLSSGDIVTAIDGAGNPVAAPIKAIYMTSSPLLIVRTPRGVLKTTPEHPLALVSGDFRPAGNLLPGNEVLIWQNSEQRRAKVLAVQQINTYESVYNLTVASPHTFVADNFIVHNKGGGGGGSRGGSYHSSSRSSGSSSDGSVIVFVIAFFSISISIIIIVALLVKSSQKDNLDHLYSVSQIQGKCDRTLKLLEFLSKQDSSMSPDALKKTTESVFLKLQSCWQSREYTPIQPLLMPDLYQNHLAQLQSMLRNHEINIIDHIKIERIDLVNVRYPLKQNDREFTALVTATAQDYYLDDRTRTRLRGDEAPAQFQEFWTFQYRNRIWLLREIEQSGESDILKEDNFVEQLTDKAIDQIYGSAVSQSSPAGPWLEKAVETKETRIERMLYFLVQTDKLWNRSAMLLTSRNVFIKLIAAWESGDTARIPSDDLFPETARNLLGQIIRNRTAETVLEFRNLCIRKTELILINNFPDNSRDEFVVRIRAHAQKILKQHGVLVRQDEDVTPFEQYLTFGRLNNQWKLKEVVNEGEKDSLIQRENIDQESSPQQVQWYYQHKRAL